MKDAIKKATEGGWKEPRTIIDARREYPDLADAWIWVTPSFWKCLGKGLGYTDHYLLFRIFKLDGLTAPWWRGQMYSFIDHLAEGKSADSFFEELLPSPLSEEEGRN